MKKFRFNLETVLKVKEGEEQKAREELEKVLVELNKLEKIIKSLEGEKIEVEGEWRGQTHESKEVGEYKVYRGYLKALLYRISEKQDQMLKLRNLEANKRQAYIKARTDKKTLENLKDKKFKEWSETLGKLESKELDDQSMGKYIRNKGQVHE